MKDCIYVILVNYKNASMTIDCITSIKQSSYDNYHIVVIDNASNDGSYLKLVNEYCNDSYITIIEARENNGFSAGNNIGIDYAIKNGADYIMLLNNDTVIDPLMITLLHGKASPNTVTLPLMFYYSEPNKIWYAGGEIDYKKGLIKHWGQDSKDIVKYNKDKECSFMTGCCALISTNIINQVGLLDEHYFMYGEDVDYSIRLQKSGVKILYAPAAKLWHKVGGSSVSSKLNIYYDTRNKLILMDKYNFPIYAKISYRVKILLLYIRGLLKKNNDIYFKKAYQDYKRGINGKVDLNRTKI